MEHFKEINGYPSSFTAASVLQRLTEGIGFRYFWGTDGLTDSDMSFTSGNSGRTIYETLDHVFYMAKFVANSIEGKPTSFPESASGLSFSELRKATLEKLAQITTMLTILSDQDLGAKKIKGAVEGNAFEAEIWHLMNGPLLDLGHHIGQVISLRRSNGNPIDSRVEPFMGKRMD